MAFTSLRLLALAPLLLLAACASSPPPPPKAVVVATRPLMVYPTDYASVKADDVLFRAIGLVGTPYHWGGNTPAAGFDCSGLIGFVYHDAAGIALPRTTRDLIAMRSPTIDRNALRSGDLVFFSTQRNGQVSHAGIYVGEGRFVHAPRTGGTVRLEYLNKPYWQKAYLAAKRVIQPERLAQTALP